MLDTATHKSLWVVRKYADLASFQKDEPFAICEIDGNLFLNEGISLMLSRFIGGAGTAFDNSNAHIGVGDGTGEALASQTGLQGENKTYIPMEANYPQVSGQSVTFRAVADGDTANHNWREFTVANGNSDAAVNMNRKVDDQGTKAQGQVWTVDLILSIS